METFSTLLSISGGNLPVTSEFPAQRPVRRSVDVFIDLRLNKRLSKQSWGWWFETLSRPLWCDSNVSSYFLILLGGVRSSSVDKSKPDKRSRSRSRPSSAKSEKSSKSESSDSVGLQPYNSVSSSEHERQYQPQSFAGLHIEDVLQENEELKVKVSYLHIDGLMQERRNSVANGLELRLSCTNPSILYTYNKYCPCLYPCQSMCLQNQGVFCG